MWGLSVPMKNSLTKNPESMDCCTKSNFSWEEKTVSKIRERCSRRHSYLRSAAKVTADAMAVGEFQSPNTSLAISSGLMYSKSDAHSWSSRNAVEDVLPAPLGPATITTFGLFVSIGMEFFLLVSQFHRPWRKRLLHRFVSITAESSICLLPSSYCALTDMLQKQFKLFIGRFHRRIH